VESQRQADRDETASAAPSAPAIAAADAPGAVLGRYRIERELGAGAVGAVHAAFDPDLERRIALKVLRRAAASDEARQRLLREARAMAQLAHPNVVTVYEVGTAAGRDFIAMELIHGETLADWLRAAPRSPTAILDAFLAAGRGLAAAHAAGIVHRDFKPRNVLRSRDGRIAVTDFGLACDAEAGVPLALDDTLPLGAASGARSERHELTETGALVGTPAYMAPEQWRGDAITPGTDQFAYCVALWEALSGERPYRGQSLDELSRRIAAGPAALDASRIPRRLRGLLRRGLDPDPARRWPSMTVLLHCLERTRHVRIAVAVPAAIGAIAAAVAVGVALYPGEPAALPCEPPARDVERVWSPSIAAELRAASSPAETAAFDAAYRDWQIARVAACHAPPRIRPAQLQCLDGVLRRFDALRQAQQRVPGAAAEELQAQLIDPEVCRATAADRVPRLTLAPSRDAIAAYALLARSTTAAPPPRAELTRLAGTATGDPCARVIATLAFAAVWLSTEDTRALTANADGAAEQCGDERLRADLRIRSSRFQWELPIVGPRGEAAIANARIAASRVLQPELDAMLALQDLVLAQQRQQWDRAFRLADAAIDDYRVRGLELHQLGAVIARNELRLARSEPADLAAIAGEVERWRPVAAASQRADLVRRLALQDGTARFWRGDVVTAHNALIQLPAVPLGQAGGSRRITGEVVDDRGRPVAGARVAAGSMLFADSAGIGLQAFVVNKRYLDDLRITTSDAGGRFVIEDSAPTGGIAAQQADRRSPPVRIADRVRLVLEPTRTVTGKVELGGIAHTHVKVECVEIDAPPGTLATMAPVAADGSFVVRGASVRALQLSAFAGDDSVFRIESRAVPASPNAAEVRIDLAATTHAIDVVVGSAVVPPLGGAIVILYPGRHRVASVQDLMRLPMAGTGFATPASTAEVPSGLRDRIQPGDLVAHIAYSGHEDLTVCAINMSGDWMDAALSRKWQAHLPRLPFACEHVGRDATVAALRVPAQQRLD
jgi:tRNA A-37 threonylcarbamoyl transferase component Bud32